MQEPVMDPEYWRQRLLAAHCEVHRAVFNGSIDQFRPLERKHKAALAELDPAANVLDAGCGYGRLCPHFPKHWRGRYLGVDISPALIALAAQFNPERFVFQVGDIRKLTVPNSSYDVAIVCSVKPMIIRNCGQEVWDDAERELLRVAKELLFLEFGEYD